MARDPATAGRPAILARVAARLTTPFIGGAALAAAPVLFTAGGIKDAYPINGFGFGFGELLYRAGLIGHRTDSFPFGLFQLAAMIPVLWLGVRAVMRRPSMARWMGAYAGLLFAFTFFARFFNDTYVGIVIGMFLLAAALGNRLLVAMPGRQTEQVAA